MTGTQGSRQAALLLHALSTSDRAWMLERIDSHDRDALNALLDELKELGIPTDESLVSRAIENFSPTTQNVELAVGISDDIAFQNTVRSIELMDPNMLASAMLDEPDLLIARVLSIRPWPWQELMLSQYSVIRRKRIAEYMLELREQNNRIGTTQFVHGNRLVKSLLTVVAERVFLLSTQLGTAGNELNIKQSTKMEMPWFRQTIEKIKAY